MRSDLRIGQLANRTQCDIATIRYYEQAGVLPKPERSTGNYRLYGDIHIERLSFIRRCRSLDMTLDEIRTLLRFRDAPARNCGDVNRLLDEHIGHVAERIADLKRLETQLRKLRQLCHKAQSVKDCGILNELAHHEARERKRAGHMHGTHPHRASR